MTDQTTNIIARQTSGIHVLSFTRPDVIDPVYIQQAGDEIYRLLKPLEQPKVVMDFGNVQYLSSAALGMLVALNTVVGRQDGDLRIANVHNEVYGVFKLTKLPKLIKMHDTVDEAIRKLSR